MIRQRPATFFSLLVAFLVFGASNHCVIEDVVATIGNKIFGVEMPNHLSNHLGSTSQHKHSESSESPTQEHEHGYPHPSLVIINVGKSADSVKLAIGLLSITFLVVFVSWLKCREETSISALTFATGDPPGYLRQLICSLTSAPQAPPS